jgi:hypothetical protein
MAGMHHKCTHDGFLWALGVGESCCELAKIRTDWDWEKASGLVMLVACHRVIMTAALMNRIFLSTVVQYAFHEDNK